MKVSFLKPVFVLFIFSLICTACQPAAKKVEGEDTQKEKDALKTEEAMLVGPVVRQDFLADPYKLWFEEEYNIYALDSNVLASIPVEKLNRKIKVFLGTWCSDSQRELPRFYKILDYLDYDKSQLEVIALDREKKSGNNEQEGWNIEFVPTFIFLEDGQEVGRIIETPNETLEKDLLAILENVN